ncbi:hypothetical protein HPB47_011327 [Ixodes persulcatus]|uniref:Uncharacterized protein n=1 Tax=Ixodes persulcatus TaxID=34615 RepID=A0AC60NWL2_IXOPE|nr:hypothetical protein HPB47_011327 [Ixodes persulcatus]
MFQRYAAGFQGHGVTKGEKVLVHLDNSPENTIAMFSVVFAGAVAVTSDPILSKDDILYRIRHSNATYILTTESEASRLRDMLDMIHMKATTLLETLSIMLTLAKKIEEKGDICYYNEDGQFFFVERITQTFLCMGMRVAPSSIERVLLSHEGIADAAVTAISHPEYEEVAKAFVVLKKPRSEITEEKLQIFVAGQVRPHMQLHGGVKIVEKIPKDNRGKVQRKQLELLH